MFIVLDRDDSTVIATELSDDASVERTMRFAIGELAAFVARAESGRPRWVWADTSEWLPRILEAHVRVERCFDLRLCHAILRASTLTADSPIARGPRSGWDAPARPAAAVKPTALFELDDELERESRLDPVAEFVAQREAVALATDPGRIARLLSAESAGALIAQELSFAGLPWSASRHDELLTQLLGPRPVDGARPRRMQELLDEVHELLDVPAFNPDSPSELIRALGNAGLQVTSTRSWELRRIEHPAIAPLLAYKKLARLLSANGWHWLETWVANGRFRPVYVPGGVVTGRWASDGGGALQLPKPIRGAVVADPGWTFVVADAAQVEPRVLAAMAGDTAMARAGVGDLYDGIVASGAVPTRAKAKVAMLGAMYGATTGESGRLLPALARAFPRALALVEAAARAGERGERVTTTLGRSSPVPSALSVVDAYGEPGAASEATRSRERARSWGRFTRNFVVQGSAAEWALCWMASLRAAIAARDPGRWFVDGPHLVFFLHDEIVVHCPIDEAQEVAELVRRAASDAGRLMFGDFPIDFPVTIAIVESYGDAK